jgi:hypothetical protein
MNKRTLLNLLIALAIGAAIFFGFQLVNSPVTYDANIYVSSSANGEYDVVFNVFMWRRLFGSSPLASPTISVQANAPGSCTIDDGETSITCTAEVKVANSIPTAEGTVTVKGPAGEVVLKRTAEGR